MKGLREILEACEEAGYCYNGELRDGGTGTYWVDMAAGKLYEYESDNDLLGVSDLSDIQIMSIEEMEL